MSETEKKELWDPLNSHQTFYTKEWQEIPYYPIKKFVRNEQEQEYWMQRPKDAEPRATGWVGGNEGLFYVLRDNLLWWPL